MPGEAPPDVTPPPLPPAVVVVAVQSSPWWKSRTLWAAAIMEIITLLSAPELTQQLGGTKAAQIVGTVSMVLTIVLRFITFAPLTGSMGATSAMAAQPAALANSAEASSPTLVRVP